MAIGSHLDRESTYEVSCNIFHHLHEQQWPPTSLKQKACCRNGSSSYVSLLSTSTTGLTPSKVSIGSIANSVQAYYALNGTREVYAGSAPQSTPEGVPKRTIVAKESTSPVTPLSARTFGTWTALSSVIRLYGAYNIHDKLVYELCIWTYAIAWVHFTSELFVFKTARIGRGIAGPMAVATGTLAWMLMQWGAYVN